jgi:hypothetical protein
MYEQDGKLIHNRLRLVIQLGIGERTYLARALVIADLMYYIQKWIGKFIIFKQDKDNTIAINHVPDKILENLLERYP